VIISTPICDFLRKFLEICRERGIFTEKTVKRERKMTENDILRALGEAYHRAGTQSALASLAGVSQGRIADYLNGRCSVGNMTVSTLLKLFPDMVVDFFGGKSASSADNALKEQLLEIFDSLDERSKIRLVAMVAANFGEKLRQEEGK